MEQPALGTPQALRVVHVLALPGAGGAEVYVKDLAIELLRQGHRPIIAFISRAADVGRDASYERSFLQELERKGIPYGFLGHECRRNLMLGAMRVRRFCREQNADLYHSHLKYALVFGALHRLPHIHTHHNIRPNAPLWMYAVFNRLVNEYVGISRLCGQMLFQFTGRRVTTIHNAVDAARVAPYGASLRSFSGRLKCIAIGHIGVQKNLGPLVEALALLPFDDRARIHVSVVGDGEVEAIDALTQSIAAHGLRDTVSLAGSRDDVGPLLQQANLFLMTSAWEGLPIALLEATISGLPFIATDVGGCPEVAEICGNGVIVPVNDPRAIAAELRHFLSDPNRIHRLSANAISNADAFAIRSCVQKHVELYRRCLLRRRQPNRRAALRLRNE